MQLQARESKHHSETNPAAHNRLDRRGFAVIWRGNAAATAGPLRMTTDRARSALSKAHSNRQYRAPRSRAMRSLSHRSGLPMLSPSRTVCTPASVGSQVGSHSLWTSADGYGRLWTANRLVPDAMDRSGLLWTTCVHLRIRRLGIRVPPGVLLTRASEHWFSPNAATKTRRWFSAVNSRPGMPKRSTVSRFHAPMHPPCTHDAPTDPVSRQSASTFGSPSAVWAVRLQRPARCFYVCQVAVSGGGWCSSSRQTLRAM